MHRLVPIDGKSDYYYPNRKYVLFISDPIRNIYGPQTTKVAVKQVKDVLRADDSQMEAVIMEMKIMSNLKMHPNLVNLLGACTSELCYNKISLLLEFCPYGDWLNTDQ